MAAAPFILLMAQANKRLLLASGVTMGICLVNGQAFIEACSSDLTSYMNMLMVITDPVGKTLRGFLKAQGAGPTLGGELVTNGTMEAFSGSPLTADNWTGPDGYTSGIRQSSDPYSGTYAGSFRVNVDDGGHHGSGTPADYYAYQSIYSGASDNDKLFLVTAQVKAASATVTPRIGLTDADLTNAVWADSAANPATYTALSGYVTPEHSSTALRVILNDASDVEDCTTLWDDISCRRVTAPSNTGYTITNASGGTTYNWLSKDTGFDPNSASYTVAIFAV